MRYVLRRNVLRTLAAVMAFGAGLGVFAWMPLGYDGNFVRTLGLTLLGCVLLTTGARALSELYGMMGGNWRRYELAPCLDDGNTVLSEAALDMGFRRKTCEGYSFYVMQVRDAASVTVRVTGTVKETPAFRRRVRTLAKYLRVWQEKNGVHDKQSVWCVRELTRDVMTIGVCGQTDAEIDQKLLAHKITLDGVELISSSDLLAEDRTVRLKLPQEADILQGLWIQALFVSSDGHIVPAEVIERGFWARPEAYPSCGTLQGFCEDQLRRYVKVPLGEVFVAGIGMIIEDVGAPVVVCGVTLTRPLSELISVTPDSQVTALNAREALVWYCLKHAGKWSGVRVSG